MRGQRPVLGQDVIHNEHIVTGAGGQTQILFVDQSALTISQNADMTIDNFVYDPNAGKGQLAMSTAQGVARFVGGQLSKQDNGVTINTPSATIGVRGGILLLYVGPDGRTDVVDAFAERIYVQGLCGKIGADNQDVSADEAVGCGALQSSAAQVT